MLLQPPVPRTPELGNPIGRLVSSDRAAGAALGIVVDRLVGEVRGPHPVAVFGSVMVRVERLLYRSSRANGVVYAVFGLGLGIAAGYGCKSILGRAGVTVVTWVVSAGRMLGETGRSVGDALGSGDFASARAMLPALVGRDATGLDEGEIARAVVESIAENAVDAMVAPALWAALCGPVGAAGHRALNTMDAMVGHRSPRYERYGWASARLDDVAAWVPARACVLLVVVARPHRARPILAAVRRDAPSHPSPNAGVAEAAFAGALGIQLGGTNRYGDHVEQRVLLGDGEAPSGRDVERAERLLRDITWVLVGALSLPTFVRALRRLRRHTA